MELEIGVWLSPKAESTDLKGPFCFYRVVLWGFPTGSTQSLTECSSHPSLKLSYRCLHLDLVYDFITEEKQVQEGCGSSQLKFGAEPAWVNCPWDESLPSSVQRGVQLLRWGCSHCRPQF